MHVSPFLKMQLYVVWGIREKFLIMNFGAKLHVPLGLIVTLCTALGLKIKLHAFLAIKTEHRIAFCYHK